MKRVEGRAGFEPAPAALLPLFRRKTLPSQIARHPPGGGIIKKLLLGGTPPGRAAWCIRAAVSRVGVRKR